MQGFSMLQQSKDSVSFSVIKKGKYQEILHEIFLKVQNTDIIEIKL